MAARPQLSVVIPTRDRPALLREALATAVGQRCVGTDDVEVVVCDNASDAATATLVHEVAGELGDGRVRYVRSERALPAHESWDWALAQAQGEWVTLLPDDDGLVPSTPGRLAPLLDQPGVATVAWPIAWYTHPATGDEAENWLSVDPFTGGVSEIDAPDQLRRMFERRERRPLPGVVNAVARRDALERLRRGVGRVCGAPDPAWSACAALLAGERRYLVLDLPLTVGGVSPAGIGAGFLRDERRAHQVIREFDVDDLFQRVPLRSRTCANLMAETLVRVREAVPELAANDLDVARYFVTCYEELVDPRRRLDARAEALSEWRSALRRQPLGVRARVFGQLAAERPTARARQFARRFSALRRLGRTRRGRPTGGAFLRVDGAHHGFGTLAGAAAYLDREVLPPA